MTARPLTPFLISLAIAGICGFNPAAAGNVPSAVSKTVATTADANAAAVEAEVARGNLLAALARDLSAHFNADGELQLDTLRPWNLPASAPAQEWSATITEFPASLTSTILLRVRVTAPGQPSRDDTLTCKAQLFRDAWVVQSPTERGAAFDPALCESRRIDALRERDTVPTAIGAGTEYVFLRPIPVGRLVTWRDLTRRSLVRKGELIEVAAIDGPLQIVIKALAMQDGGQGETVRVRNIESKREFAATVVSEKRAQVRF